MSFMIAEGMSIKTRLLHRVKEITNDNDTVHHILDVYGSTLSRFREPTLARNLCGRVAVVLAKAGR